MRPVAQLNSGGSFRSHFAAFAGLFFDEFAQGFLGAFAFDGDGGLGGDVAEDLFLFFGVGLVVVVILDRHDADGLALDGEGDAEPDGGGASGLDVAEMAESLGDDLVALAPAAFGELPVGEDGASVAASVNAGEGGCRSFGIAASAGRVRW